MSPWSTNICAGRRSAPAIYAAFIAGLKKKFPGQAVPGRALRDHQPEFSPHLLDPGLDEAGIGKKLESYDPRYYATYYAIDAVNSSRDESGVMDAIDGPIRW